MVGYGISCFARSQKNKANKAKKGRLPLLEDRKGNFWFGTRGKAYFYDGKTFTIFKNSDGKAFNNVRSIIEDQKGYIWFGASIIKDQKRVSGKGSIVTVDEGLWCYDGKSYTKIPGRAASAIIEDQKGNIWTTGAINPNGVGAWKLSRYAQETCTIKTPLQRTS